MEFDIVRDRAWLETQLDAIGANGPDLDRELNYLANGPKAVGDRYITPGELTFRRHAPLVRPVTAKFVSAFFKNGVTRERMAIGQASGGSEDVSVYDDGDGVFETSGAPRGIGQTDVFIRNDGDRGEDITRDVLACANFVLVRCFTYDESSGKFVPRDGPVDFMVLSEKIRALSEFPPSLEFDDGRKQAWEILNATENLRIATLMTLYRFAKTAFESRNGRPPELARVIDFGEIRGMTEGGEIENRCAASLLSSLLVESRINPAPGTNILPLIAIHAAHVINATDGAYGIGVLQHFSAKQWTAVLEDPAEAKALSFALASALAPGGFSVTKDLHASQGSDVERQLLNLLWSEGPDLSPWFQSVVATAFLVARKSDPEFFNAAARGLAESPAAAEALRNDCVRLGIDADRATVADIVFGRLKILTEATHGNIYAHATLIEVVLDAFGDIAGAVPEGMPVRERAFEWCRGFYAGFGTFVDRSTPVETQARQKNDDRRLILKAQGALAALSPAKARRVFFEESFSPLDVSFDPRIDKNLAHNAYYRRIGAAERMAALDGRAKLAFERRLDEENNEWGRVAEKAVRENEVFRLEFFKEAHAATDPDALDQVRKTLATFDPDGLLTRNLAFAHVLRCLYVQRKTFDPTFVPNADFNAEYVSSLDLAGFIRTRIPTRVYETEAREFDAWIIGLKRDNPDFFTRLMAAVRALPEEQRRLPIDTLFMEVNEVEFFQYELDPDSGPTAMLDFVGTIRSWTSGYHGRVLTRMRAFMDQDAIRRDKAVNPGSYKRPEEYYPDFAASLSQERFEITILPILKAGETGVTAPGTEFPEAEAMRLLSYFDGTGFSAYLPQWLMFIIEHRFTRENGKESFAPLCKAFDLLAATKFPRKLMRELFEDRGYVARPDGSDPSRETVLYESALACLKNLPDKEPIQPFYDDGGIESVRKKILRAANVDLSLMPAPYGELKEKFTAKTVGPGGYFKYRRQARDLLKTHKIDAIRTILDEALTDKELAYPANAPLRALFPGLIGLIVTNDRLERSLYAIATSSSSANKGASSIIDFSSIMIRWAGRNHVDLTDVFTEAFANYRVPERVGEAQNKVVKTRERIADVDREIADIHTRRSLSAAFAALPVGDGDDERLKELKESKRILERELARLEEERNAEIVALSRDPSLMPEQALFQLITSIYNSIRRQYLKEVLITGGEPTARLIESYLADHLIPKKRELLDDMGLPERPEQTERLIDVEKRIAFLTDVLAQMETNT
jgi:hypothetical protein